MAANYSPYTNAPARPRAPSYTGLPPLHDAAPPKPRHLELHAHDEQPHEPYPTTAIAFADAAASLTTSSLSSSSYAGSAADEGGRARADAETLAARLVGAFDPLQLDRSLAMQAQT